MNRIVTCRASVIALALAFSGPTFAQGMAGPGMNMKAAAHAGNTAQKILSENEKVRVADIVMPPGYFSAMQTRPMRVIYVIAGGTLERTYSDGSKEVVVEKAGESKLLSGQPPFSFRVIGKRTIRLFEVIVK